ncbi:MAG: taurine ABC transporter permease [Betaproteobacteria bacterium HGW-Betaproteobacteria-9]|jgi:sulfonate transport system permease protein|nr:ABC transporter permease [Hydrogenophaga sp.]PKO26279.1 MAG: taurine ABC transporter permease [Betaproteobacteria bacterium HGW-Betaproteobacteria-9]
MSIEKSSVVVPPALRGWVLPALILLVWWWAVASGWSTSPLLVSPGAVWDRALQQFTSGELAVALSASLWRMAWGFAIGSAIGLVFGVLLGGSRWFDRLVGPSFHTLKQISLFAWIPMLSMWFGLGDGAKIAFVAMAAFFPVVLNTFEGIRSVPREYIEVARVYDFSLWQLLTRVIAPSAAPSVFTGIQLSLIYTWLATLGAEYLLASGKGIGNTLIDGREHFEMDLVLFGVVVIGLVGFVLNWALGALEQRLLAWRERTVARY